MLDSGGGPGLKRTARAGRKLAKPDIKVKLASGMSSPDRLVDLAEVIALVRANGLSREFAGSLDPSVQEKFRELWLAAQTKSEY